MPHVIQTTPLELLLVSNTLFCRGKEDHSQNTQMQVAETTPTIYLCGL